MIRTILLTALALLHLSGCVQGQATTAAQADGCDLSAETAEQAGEDCARAWIDANLKMNDIQVLGTHNSYKDWISPDEFERFMEVAPEAARTLEYAHEPLTAQLEWGIRQFEIDIIYDPEGGIYLDPLLRRDVLTRGGSAPELRFKEELSRPGFKVMHVPDLDYRTTCPTLVSCLDEIRSWSVLNPDHAPIFIMLNTKESAAPWDGVAPVRPFDAAAWDALDREVTSVFPLSSIITPAEIQGEYSAVRDGVLANNWPTIGEARGRVMFGVLASRKSTRPYREGPGGIAARPMFVRAVSSDADAAWLMWDDPIENQQAIREAVEMGFLVRTRTEQDTVEVRTGDTVKRAAAFDSSAQFISTDYYKPNPAFSGYSVAMPGGAIARCNPLRVPAACAGRRIE